MTSLNCHGNTNASGLKVLTGQTRDSSVAFPGQSLSGSREEEEEEDQEEGENELLPRDAIARL